jgi:hypothetical protein
MAFDQETASGVADAGVANPGARNQSPLLRLHSKAVDSLRGRAIVFLGLVLLLAGLLVVLEFPHVGYNARLHWDAETSLYTLQSTPGRDVLDQARRHVFDIETIGHATDPVKATEIFNSGDPRFNHNSLEIVRSYYSQISYAISRYVLDKVGSWTGSPVDAVLAFQYTAPPPPPVRSWRVGCGCCRWPRRSSSPAR